MSKYTYDLNYFKKIDNQEKAYWLGFLYADGSVNTFYDDGKLRSMTLEIGLSIKDEEHLVKFKESLNSDIPIFNKTNKLKGKEYSSVRIQLNNTEICNDLCNLGCVPRKTYILRLPNEHIVPKIYMRDFLRGFFDGDGCICTSVMGNKPHIVTNITGTSDMLQDISDFLLNNKIIRTKPFISKDKRRENTYRFYIYGTDTNKEFLDYLYKDSKIYLDRKYQHYKEFYKNYNDKLNKRGVYFNKRMGRYVATITINNKRKSKSFKTIEEAIEQRKNYELEKLNLIAH